MNCQQPQAHPDRCGCMPHGTEQVSSAWLAQLREEYRLFGEQNALLVQRCRNLEAVQQASLERRGTIKAAAGQLGWTADREDGPLEFLIQQAKRCRELGNLADQWAEKNGALRAENVRLAEWYSEAGTREDTLRTEIEALRKDAGRYRWLREQHNALPGCGDYSVMKFCQRANEWLHTDFKLDAEIDKAMEAGQ